MVIENDTCIIEVSHFKAMILFDTWQYCFIWLAKLSEVKTGQSTVICDVLRMEQKHRDIIERNFTSLVDMTKLDILVPLLYEKNVFSKEMIADYMDTAKEISTRKCKLYMDITRRGPEAFDKLVESLYETGHWDLVRILSPTHALNAKPEFISLKNVPKKKANGHTTGSSSSSSVTNPTSNISINTGNIMSNNPKPIKVIKAKSFGKSSHPDIPCYSMKSRRRGIFFMINNIQFDNNIEEPRDGAIHDQKNLEELFFQIGFHKIMIYNNLPKKEMEDCLVKFANLDELNQTDCVFFVFASHGRFQNRETYIRCKDGGIIDCMKVLEMFNNKNCPSLHNIPKVFIFQLCRGDKFDYGYKSEGGPIEFNRTKTDGRSDQYQMRTFSDMLIAHSTVPGFTSHRDIYLGSWYILSLCEVFMNHSYNTHVEDLFKLVDQYLQNMNLQQKTLQTSSVENWGFNKHCYLNPGLYEN